MSTIRKHRRFLFSRRLTILLSLWASPGLFGQHVDFGGEVRPILSDACFSCHGPDEGTRQAGLRLDTKDGAFADPGGRQVIVPGDAANSRLYQRISHEQEIARMPPPQAHRKLTSKEVETIRRWIEQGARSETHWAFSAPVRPELPKVSNAAWGRNHIDQFVMARLDAEGLKPSREADKRTLLRRLSLDLTGLPPSPREVEAFLADPLPSAYEKQVDRLLSSPHYGERMALPWLDLARYADTHGYSVDSQRDMYRWRDWVIDAFNRNERFDQFTIEQIAGDLLPEPTVEQRIATAFNRNHMINFEGGAIPEEYHVEYVVDRVETVSNVWLGLTFGCARCHDHKYDPITHKDFYRFFAFFNNVPEKGLDGDFGNAEPTLLLPARQQEDRLHQIQDRLATMQSELPDGEADRLVKQWQATAFATIPRATTDALFAHYGFDGNTSDSSGNYHQAQVVAGDLSFGDGRVGRAAGFDGETHLTLLDTAEFDLNKPMTIAFWIVAGGLETKAFLQKMDGGGERQGLELWFEKARSIPGELRRDHHLHFQLTCDKQVLEVRTTGDFAERRKGSNWYHVAVRYDGSGRAAGVNILLNGEETATEVVSDTLTGPLRANRPFEISNRELSPAGFSGSVDELRLYQRLLTAEDVEALRLHEPIRSLLLTPEGDCDTLLAEWAGHEDESGYKPSPEMRGCKSRRETLRDYYLSQVDTGRPSALHAERKKLEAERGQIEKEADSVMVMREMNKPQETHILGRGDYRNAGEAVTAGLPSWLPPLPAGAEPNRLALAKWLVDPSNPLTARVAVNRFWQMYFGRGLVASSENFGSQGETPTHPKLLDWLATEFVRTGWDVKAMQRLIVTSATYRQASHIPPALLEMDPENRLLGRGPRFRMPAETVRDNALAISGLLDGEVGGPSVFPYQPPGLWEAVAYGDYFTAQTYAPSRGKDLYRRSLYTFWKRSSPPASFSTFDAPDREKCIARRARTNTPLQALVLMNDPTYIEAARTLATHAVEEAGGDEKQRIECIFERALARPPSQQETAALLMLAKQESERFRSQPQAAKELLAVGASPVDEGIAQDDLAAWTMVSSAILNLDEVVTKE